MIYNQKQKYIPYYLFLLGFLINYAPASFAEISLDKKNMNLVKEYGSNYLFKKNNANTSI